MTRQVEVMNELTLSEVLRCQHVKRWHIVRVAREQTVAEHQWAVAVIAQHLCMRLGARPPYLLEWALWHDVPEVVTGDLPTPTSEALGEHLAELERGTSTTWSSFRTATPPGSFTAIVVKLADLIEAITFLHTEGVGDFTALVKTKLQNKLAQKVEEAMVLYPDSRLQEAVAAVSAEAINVNGGYFDK